MTDQTEAVDVWNAEDRDRYEVLIDGELAGFAQYIRKGGRYVFVHTEIDPRFEGRGLGSILAQRALDDVRAQGAPVVPLCPFIAGYLEKHPEYDDLVDHALLQRFESAG
jgi:predicted GNAT family acetyltransferase